MLQSLLIRKILFAVNIVLALLLAVFLVLMVRTAVADRDTARLASASVAASETDVTLARVGPRREYDGLVRSGLFGAAARTKGADTGVTPPPALTTAEVETTLPIKLFGTVFAGVDDPLATARLEVQGGRSGTYYVDEEVIDGVFLKEVRWREVLLDNRKANRTEVLRQEEEGTGTGNRVTRVTPTSGPIRPIRSAPSPVVSLNREDIVAKLEENYETLANVAVQEVTDDAGDVIGLTTDNIEDLPLAKELGFRDGDVLTDVNNEKVDSIEKIETVLEKYSRGHTFRIGILRDGEPVTMIFRLR